MNLPASARASAADCLLIPPIMIKFLTLRVVEKICVKGKLRGPRLTITPLGQTTCVIYNWHCHLGEASEHWLETGGFTGAIRGINRPNSCLFPGEINHDNMPGPK